MNCDQARDRLIDLVYGELPAEEAATAERHLSSCPACRTEHDRLRLGRRAMARLRAGEPEAPAAPEVLLESPPGASADEGRVAIPTYVGTHARRFRRRPPVIRWGPIAASAAAIVLVLGGVVLFYQTRPPQTAYAGPVEIQRLNVSLTILSTPEWAAANLVPMAQQLRQQKLQPPPNVQVQDTFQQDLPQPGRPWPGMALVRDQRIVRNLPEGASAVKFTGVPGGILPDTVRLRSLDRPDGLTVLEQNYQYDLASAWAVLNRYLDKPVAVTFQAGQTVGGDLLSFDNNTLVIRPKGEGPRSLARAELTDIRLAGLPQGLLTLPTLLWRIQNNARRQQQFEVAYLTYGLTWRADYVLKLHPAGPGAGKSEIRPSADSTGSPQAGSGRPERVEGRNPKSEILDSADLVGYATVANNSGVTYEDAQLKLMAGDLNLIRPPANELYFQFGEEGQLAKRKLGDLSFQEKSFFEYHLYTLGRATTIRDAETKQIELVSGDGLKLKRAYVFDPQENPTAARVVSELDNSKANGLGKPLPKGVVRLYAPDPEGQETYVSQTTIDHTPVNEKLRLPWGHAFDIACSARQTGQRVNGSNVHQEHEYSLRNHKDREVTITAIVHVPPGTYRFDAAGRAWHIRQLGWIEIDVPVRADVEEKVEFSFDSNSRSGGGLASPFDKEQPKQ